MRNSYAEAQAEHNRLLRESPEYRLNEQMEIMREEILMQMPVFPWDYLHELEDRITALEQRQPEKWEGKQWDYVQQLRSEVTYLRKTLFRFMHMVLKPKKGNKKKKSELKDIEI